MSFKLQDRIQRTKGLPGKYKRLLLAMASHADKYGANVWAAKTTLAAEMGVSRFTVNRNMDGLLITGLVRGAETHRCSNDFCPKGPKHYIERGNHWTQAYDICVEALQNIIPKPKVASHFDTPQPEIVASHFATESQHILHNSGVTFCAAKQGYREHASLGINSEASVLTHGSELVSKQASYDSSQSVEDNTAAPELTPQEAELLQEITPIRFLDKDYTHKCDLAFILNWGTKLGVDVFELLRYNREHKKGGLRIRTVADFVKAMMGDAEGNFTLFNEYVTWRDKAKPNPNAKPTLACRKCGGREVCVSPKPTSVWGHEDAECGTTPKAFDIEEA